MRALGTLGAVLISLALGCGGGAGAGDASLDGATPSGACTPGSCGAGRVCAEGLCSATPPATLCGTNPFATEDGCGASAVCLGGLDVDGARVDDRRCYAFGACGADGRCPVSTHGAACNVEGASTWFAEKGAVCIAGLCRTGADCPAAFSCIVDSRGRLGYCSDGSVGAVCRVSTDCHSGTCMTLGGLGNCL